MGDRVSVQFAQTKYNGSLWKSASLYSHWGGAGLVRSACKYVESLRNVDSDSEKFWKGMPLGRLDPDTVMFNFVWYMGAQNKKGAGRKNPLYAAAGDYRLITGECAENNGHHMIMCDTPETLRKAARYATKAAGHALPDKQSVAN